MAVSWPLRARGSRVRSCKFHRPTPQQCPIPTLLHPHSPRWLEVFAAEAKQIEAALAGLPLGVRSLQALDHHAANLGGLGFEPIGEFGIEGRRYFRKHMAAGVRRHHLHAFAAGSPQVRRHLALSDHLIVNPSAAAALAGLR